MDNGEPRCIAFGGLRVDDAIEEALFGVVGPGARRRGRWRRPSRQPQLRDQAREALGRDLEAARYTADRAFRQYDAADPANRLVAGELEGCRNEALARVAEVESKIVAHEAASPTPAIDPAALALLGANLETVWSAPTTDARLKKRIVRALIHEVVADIDDAASEIVVVVHSPGGVHSEIRLPKRRRGQRNSTSADVIAGRPRVGVDCRRRLDRRPPQPQWPPDRPWQPLDPRARHRVAFAPSHLRSSGPLTTASSPGSISLTPHAF